MPRPKPTIDHGYQLAGTVFGHWTVLDQTGTQDGHRLWRCRCRCGNLGQVTSKALLAGRSTRCRRCACSLKGHMTAAANRKRRAKE
jgi:hypothetical protein